MPLRKADSVLKFYASCGIDVVLRRDVAQRCLDASVKWSGGAADPPGIS